MCVCVCVYQFLNSQYIQTQIINSTIRESEPKLNLACFIGKRDATELYIMAFLHTNAHIHIHTYSHSFSHLHFLLYFFSFIRAYVIELFLNLADLHSRQIYVIVSCFKLFSDKFVKPHNADMYVLLIKAGTQSVLNYL